LWRKAKGCFNARIGKIPAGLAGKIHERAGDGFRGVRTHGMAADADTVAINLSQEPRHTLPGQAFACSTAMRKRS